MEICDSSLLLKSIYMGRGYRAMRYFETSSAHNSQDIYHRHSSNKDKCLKAIFIHSTIYTAMQCTHYVNMLTNRFAYPFGLSSMHKLQLFGNFILPQFKTRTSQSKSTFPLVDLSSVDWIYSVEPLYSQLFARYSETGVQLDFVGCSKKRRWKYQQLLNHSISR